MAEPPEGMAPSQPPDGEPGAAARSVAQDRLARVEAAARYETTVPTDEGCEHRAVAFNRREEEPPGEPRGDGRGVGGRPGAHVPPRPGTAPARGPWPRSRRRAGALPPDGAGGSFPAAASSHGCVGPHRLPSARRPAPAGARRPVRVPRPGGTALRRRGCPPGRPVGIRILRAAGPAGGAVPRRRSGREPLASLLPAALQHQAATARAHAHEKAVRSTSLPVVGLERPLHRPSPSCAGDPGGPSPSRANRQPTGTAPPCQSAGRGRSCQRRRDCASFAPSGSGFPAQSGHPGSAPFPQVLKTLCKSRTLTPEPAPPGVERTFKLLTQNGLLLRRPR